MKSLLFVLNTFLLLSILVGTANAGDMQAKSFKVEVLDSLKHDVSSFANIGLQKQIKKVILELKNQGAHRSNDEDKIVRPVYVNIQGMFEKNFALEMGSNIDNVIAIFHTPAPPTPLCLNGPVDDLVSKEVLSHQESTDTILYRKKTLNSLLKNGGYIINIYPESGIAKRTRDQLQRYQSYQSEYPNHFYDIVVRDDILPEQVGATYLIESAQEWYCFAIRASQAISPKTAEEQWQLYFGKINEDMIFQECMTTLQYFNNLSQGELDKILQTFIAN